MAKLIAPSWQKDCVPYLLLLTDKVPFNIYQRLQDCEKRAYLAKFLMAVAIPEEFLVDTEIKT